MNFVKAKLALEKIAVGEILEVLLDDGEPIQNVPSSFEKGWKVSVSTTRGYAVKAGTPQCVVDKLEKSLTKAMKHSTFAGYVRAAGLDPKTSVAGSEVWTKQIREEVDSAESALKELGFIK